MDKVSILIPVYNRANLILDTLKSAFSQSYKNIEVIVYNDGSTDNTFNKIRKSKYFKKIKLINGLENRGIGYSRNRLMGAATGKYLCWLDSDDLMNSKRIEICIKLVDKYKYDIIYSDIQWFNIVNNKIKHGEIISADINKYDKNDFKSLAHNTVCASAFFNTKLKKYKFIENLHLGGEDSIWLFKILQDNPKIGYYNKPLYFYRNHSNRIGVIKRKDENKENKEKENYIISNEIKKILNNGINIS